MHIAGPLIFVKISDDTVWKCNVLQEAMSILHALLKTTSDVESLKAKMVKGRYLHLSENWKQVLSQNGKNILANRDNNSVLSGGRTAAIS